MRPRLKSASDATALAKCRGRSAATATAASAAGRWTVKDRAPTARAKDASMSVMKIDPRPRCRRCHKIPRGKMAWGNWERYAPYCSYHCQEWGRLEDAQRYLNAKRDLGLDDSPS